MKSHRQTEFPLFDGCIGLSILSEGSIIFADYQKYALFQLSDQEKARMISLIAHDHGTSKRPHLLNISRRELVVSSIGSNGTSMGVFMNHQGEPTRGLIEWNAFPLSLTFEYPYILSTHRNLGIQIHGIFHQRLVQTFETDGIIHGLYPLRKGHLLAYGESISLLKCISVDEQVIICINCSDSLLI